MQNGDPSPEVPGSAVDIQPFAFARGSNLPEPLCAQLGARWKVGHLDPSAT